MIVISGTSNNAFVYEVQDKGPYESLEVKTHITSTPPGPIVNPAKSGPVPRIQVQRDERIRL